MFQVTPGAAGPPGPGLAGGRPVVNRAPAAAVQALLQLETRRSADALQLTV